MSTTDPRAAARESILQAAAMLDRAGLARSEAITVLRACRNFPGATLADRLVDVLEQSAVDFDDRARVHRGAAQLVRERARAAPDVKEAA